MRMMWMLLFLLSFGATANVKLAEPDLNLKIEQLSNRVNYFESMIHDNKTEIQTLTEAVTNNAFTLFMFAFFCAWWAKSTGRSALGWFFLGLIFHVLTAIVLVSKTKRNF